MSDTSDAAVEKLRNENPLLHTILEEVARSAGTHERDLARRFAELYFSKAPPGIFQERKTEELAAAALGAFRFLQRSRPDRVDVEVTTPDPGSEGWSSSTTLIRTNVSERPFIVDTLRALIHAEDLAIELLIYPVIRVERNEAGEVVDLGASATGGSRESLVHCEVTQVTDPARLEWLRSRIERSLSDAVLATRDFHRMVDAVNETVTILAETAREQPNRKDEVEEVQHFLRWLRDGGFVFLGYRGYDLVDHDGERCVQIEPGSGLGILRSDETSSFARPVALSSLPDGFRSLAEGGPLLIISKTNATATVHRRSRMDYIGVKKLNEAGKVVGERRFIGLFTSQGYSEKAENIPILRRKLEVILLESGVQPGSHDYKEIHTIFNSLPKEELFLTSAEEIGADIRTVLTTFDADEVRVTLRRDPLQRGVSVMVIMGKEKFSGEVRMRIEEAFVERLRGEVLNYHLSMGEGDQARLHFYLAVPQDAFDTVTSNELEETVWVLTRTWADRVEEGLARIRAPDEAYRLAELYGKAFSPEYKAASDTDTAVSDILELEAMRREGRDVSVVLMNPHTGLAVASREPVTELKLYLRGVRLILSDFMPILENCGLRVIAVTPFEVGPRESSEAILYTFVVQGPDRQPLDIEAVGSRLARTILAVRRGDLSNDILNQLVLTAGLGGREVDVLRTYASYGFQVGAVPSRLSLPNALRKYPDIAALLFRWFDMRFNPEGPRDRGERAKEAAAIRRKFLSSLSAVSVLSDDRALRRLANLIDSTLRTNYWQGGGRIPTKRSGGVPYISLKFDCKKLEGTARTRLRYEVWVRSARMEGVHLRGARVARGGIRYSDRPDDFRTEVLGLVKTQMVKNAVIVPAGSKGGFITLRQLEPEAMGDEAREQYRTLIRGLLDITDNLKGGQPIPPEQVVCWDEPDPYLVVAADKGTAKYSDVANGVAEEYGYWLGDAFASGGSNGYDHKELGITARGAWECVRRHFIEMKKDIQSEPFTVVGIGDMSGDVFGNGMLLSRQIRLLAAFDHRDIFLDPDPDPETSFRERERLFALGRSSWQDYDTGLLSPGGMIVPRGTKEVRLSPEIQAALGIEEEGPFDGEELVRHVLRSPVELLWNGGIGTYCKASTETHADAGDASNDAVRVDATELRAGVVGEGGNLGFTQRARVEFALLGGRLNTDAIDNSGGVDLSDREVNLKILLNAAVEAGTLDPERRNPLLRDLSDPVAALVLKDNRSQSLAVSLDELRAKEAVDDLRELIAGLERLGVLDRAAEHLPTWEEIDERRDRNQTFTRPELAVLLAYAKLHLTGRILGSALPDDPAAREFLEEYFPPAALTESGEVAIEAHRLKREIVASQLSNELVDIMGAGFVYRVSRGTGRPAEDVAWAWLIASSLTGQRALMDRLRGQGEAMPPASAYRWLLGLSRVLERTTRWLLSNAGETKDIRDVVDENLAGLGRLRTAFPDIVAGEDRDRFDGLVDELQADGAEEGFARELVTLRFLDQLLEILRVHRNTDADPLDSAQTFYRVSEMFRISWLRKAIFDAAGDDRWEQRAAQALSDDLTRAHQRLVAAVMGYRGRLASVDAAVGALIAEHQDGMDRYRDLAREVESEGRARLPALTVLLRELMKVADGVQWV